MDEVPGLGDIGLGEGLEAGAGVGLTAATGGIGALALAAPAIGSVVSGLFGMAGANEQNQNAEAAQQATMNYDTQMADTQYQRGMADMKAAGLNPMLAYMQGGDSAPTAPMYQPSSPLAAMGPAVEQLGQQGGDIIKRYAQNREATAQANSAETAASVQSATAPAQIQQAQAQADKTTSDAATAMNNATASGVGARVSTAGEGAAKWSAQYGPYIDAASKVTSAGASAIDALNIFKGLKYLKQGNKQFDPQSTGTFDLKTGEIHK